MEAIRVSIKVRASIAEALRRWHDPAAPLRPHLVDFEAVAGSEARVTVEASALRHADLVQRELERHLSSFKRRIEESHGAGAGLP